MREHKAPRMLAQMTRKTLNLPAQMQPLFQHGLCGRRIPRPQSSQRILQAPGQHLAAVHPGVLFGQGRDQRLVNTQSATHIAQRTARTVTGDHGREGRPLAPVFGVNVLNDFFTALVLKVHINIGRLIALPRDKTLKQHVHARRVHLGDAQAITHRRVGRRAAPLAQDMPAAGKSHDVVHGQKIHLVFHFGNQRQLMLKLLLHCGCNALREALGRTTQGELAQGLRRGQAGQHGLHGVLVAQLVQVEGAARRHLQRVGQQLGRVNLRQPGAGAQVGLGIGLQGKPALSHRLAQAHGGGHILQRLA